MDTKDRMIHYLQDAHAAEVGIGEMLERAIGVCEGQAKTLLQEHLAQTKSQAERLERRLEQLGSDASGMKGFMNSMMANIASVMDAGHDEVDRQTMCLIKAYGTEHLERAMYESMAAYAEAIGDTETLNLARSIQQEEEMAGDKIYPLIRTYARQALGAAIENTAGERTSYGYPSP